MLKNYTKIEVDTMHGIKFYLNDEGEYHRLDGPALEYSSGTKYWYINGTEHRNIGPSDEFSDGEKRWFFKGKLHRVGSSVNSAGELWRIHGREYTKKEYFDKVWDI